MPAACLCRLLPELWRVNLPAKKKSATKPQPPTPDAKPATDASAPGSAAPPVNGTAAPGGKSGAEKSASSAPQFTSLVSKVLELADAGVGLGINVVSLLTNF